MTKEEKKEKKRGEMPVVMIFIAGVIFLVGLGGMFLLISSESEIQGRIVGGGIITVVLFLLVTTISRIPFPEVWVVDRLGTLIEKKPGYRIIVKFFGVEKIYKKVKTNIQYPISLFSDREDIRIDLKKGGQIILKDPRIWIVVPNPKKTVGTALDFEEQIREIVENRVAGTLNNLAYDEVVAIRVPKTLEEEKKMLKEKLDELISGSGSLKKFLDECKIKYKGFTLDDFDFDESTTKKRGERILTEMGKEIAENVSQSRVNEMLAISKTANNLKEAGFASFFAEQVASERYQDHLVGDKGKLQKIIWPGGGIGIGELASQWELGKKLLGEEKKEDAVEKPRKEELEKPVEEERKKTREEIRKEMEKEMEK